MANVQAAGRAREELDSLRPSSERRTSTVAPASIKPRGNSNLNA